MTETTREIRDYLLEGFTAGNGTLEEHMMVDDDFYQDVLLEEEELIQDYIDGNLLDSERELFIGQFLITKKRVEKACFAQALRKSINETAAAKNFKIKTDMETGYDLISLLTRVFSPPFFPKIISTTVLIMIGGWFVFFPSQQNRLTPLELEFAKLNEDDFSENTKYFSNRTKYQSSLSLISGNPRNSSELVKLPIESLADKIFFRLALPSQTTSSIFEIELLKGQKVIFVQKEIRIYKNSSGEELRFLIPSALVEQGLYQIKAKDSQLKTSRLSYTFLAG